MNETIRQPQTDLPAPVAGGMRWRDPLQDFYDYQRVWKREHGNARFVPAMPRETQRPMPEPDKAAGPYIPTTPPDEARVGGEYIYQAKAFDGIADGFTWFLEQAPPGMSVDRYTGRVSWTPADGGHVEVILGVRSHYGKISRQSWSVCVRKAPAARTAAHSSARGPEALPGNPPNNRAAGNASRRSPAAAPVTRGTGFTPGPLSDN